MYSLLRFHWLERRLNQQSLCCRKLSIYFGRTRLFYLIYGNYPWILFVIELMFLPFSTNMVVENLMKDLNKFPEVFSEGLGRCTKTKVKFEVNETVKPIFKHKKECVICCFATKATWKLFCPLKYRIFGLGVSKNICKNEKKNHKIPIRADFSTRLNDCLKSHTYPLPSFEEVFAKSNGGKVFLKLDLSDAYVLVWFDEKCSELLTINIHKGCMNFRLV